MQNHNWGLFDMKMMCKIILPTCFTWKFYAKSYLRIVVHESSMQNHTSELFYIVDHVKFMSA